MTTMPGPGGIITMLDMEVIFSVTDLMGIHRESVSVELTKEDPGAIGKGSADKIEITVPESESVADFAQRVRQELEAMGYTEVDPAEEEE